MSNRKKLVERRKDKRFQVKEGALAVLRPHPAKLGQIIDISRGGLAFTYIAGEGKPTGSFELEIFFSDNGFHLDKIQFETVSDFEIREVPFSSITMRRCGVRFGELTDNQVSQLEHFLRSYTLDNL
ncbi:MAG: PilZ domain-containing protein [Desulfobacterales bacterium]|nr:PilZ domain-containing protein [Desulfobacterales bacterium]